jgi:hypothetical protein
MTELLGANLLLNKIVSCEGKLFHIRYAQVINLIAQYGLRKINGIVHNVKECKICQKFFVSEGEILGTSLTDRGIIK